MAPISLPPVSEHPALSSVQGSQGSALLLHLGWRPRQAPAHWDLHHTEFPPHLPGAKRDHLPGGAEPATLPPPLLSSSSQILSSGFGKDHPSPTSRCPLVSTACLFAPVTCFACSVPPALHLKQPVRVPGRPPNPGQSRDQSGTHSSPCLLPDPTAPHPETGTVPSLPIPFAPQRPTSGTILQLRPPAAVPRLEP